MVFDVSDVSEKIEKNSLYFGVPAKKIKRVKKLVFQNFRSKK